jgi:hypothetical protein
MINARPSCATFEGSPVAKAIEILRLCSVVEVAAVMDGLAKSAASADEYQLYRELALKLEQRDRGRPGYDEEHLLDEMEWRLKNRQSQSIPRAAADVGATIADPEQKRHAGTRLAKKYRERLCASLTIGNPFRLWIMPPPS